MSPVGVARANVRQWLVEPPGKEVAAAIDRLARTESVRHVAVLPDVHLSGDVCVGAVVAADRLLFPQAVGGDIGCGILAMGFRSHVDFLADESNAAAILADLHRLVPGLCQPAKATLPEAVGPPPSGEAKLLAVLERDGRRQLGTLGRGNHFVELQADEHDQLWLMVHTGSRAVGQAVRDHYMRHAQATSTGLCALQADSPPGRAYLEDHDWARGVAYWNRRMIARAVCRILGDRIGAAPIDGAAFDVDHNHVQLENHFGESWFVHRKGAAPADAERLGSLPGSMGTASYHVVGRACADSLRSAAHGAGRRLRRGDACKRISAAELRRQMRGVWFDVRKANPLREEAPAAYKDIRAVLRAQRALVRVERALRPLLSYKAT